MLKHTITYITLFNFIFYLYGCYAITSMEITEDNLDDLKSIEITSVVSKDNEVYEFNIDEINHKPFVVDSTLIGWTKTMKNSEACNAEEVRISLSDIKTFYIEKYDIELAAGLTIGIIGLGLIVYFIISLFDTKIDFPVGGNPLGNRSF